MINDQLEEVVSRIFQFRLPIITQGKVRQQFKCVKFSSRRNTALLGCLNCIPFLIHLSKLPRTLLVMVEQIWDDWITQLPGVTEATDG